MKKFIRTTIAIIIIVITIIIYSNKHIDLTKYDIKDDAIPDSFDGYKIAQISDFHSVNSWLQANVTSLLKKLESEKPDIIVMTGDMVDTNDDGKKKVTYDFITKCSKIAPIYYVTGNHESTLNNDLDAFLETIDDLDNVVVLRNESVELVKNNDKLLLIGVDDPVFLNRKTTTQSVICGLKQKYADEYTILLAHRPERLAEYVDSGVNLVFTGHAHGGQVRLPFIGGVFAPNQGLFPEYTSGMISKNNTTMIINRGVGNSTSKFAKIRINNSPELVITTLYCK